MARDTLSEYGRDSSQLQKPRATSGGKTMSDKIDVMGYQPPVGPIGITRPGAPGLGGANLGNCGSQGRYSSGSSGAAQTTPPTGDGAGGAPGIKRLGGEGRGMGTNRKG